MFTILRKMMDATGEKEDDSDTNSKGKSEIIPH